LLQGPSKKRKVASGQSQSRRILKRYPVKKVKEGAADREVIPIPFLGDDDVELSEQDRDVFMAYGDAISFLDKLDHKGISR
jgi:nucleolar complex protein 3